MATVVAPRPVASSPRSRRSHFDNGEKRDIDVSPYLNKGIFSELKEPKVFYSVKAIDGTIQWQNEADFCPDTLYLDSKPK
jgi:hypothetical protein